MPTRCWRRHGTVYCKTGCAGGGLSLEESPDLDGTALESLGEFAAWLETRNIELRLARLKEASRDALLRANFKQLPASGLDYHSVDDAASGTPADVAASAT